MLALNGLNCRLRMDRRRLESAHIRYAILRVIQSYPDQLSVASTVFHSNTSATLLEFTPTFQRLFHEKYSGENSIIYIVHAQ